MIEKPPQWLEEIAKEGALFAATQFLYGQSSNGVYLDIDQAKEIAEEWTPAVLDTYMEIYYDAVRDRSGLLEAESADST